MRKVLEMSLGANFKVDAVATGGEAVAKAKELKPELVIADLSLDDKDGYEICRDLRADGELGATPVLLLHGSSVKFNKDKAKEVEASGDIMKPFDSQELIDKINELVS